MSLPMPVPVPGCVDCGTPFSYFEEKTITVPITVDGNTILVEVEARVCPNCGFYTVDMENQRKLEAAQDALARGNLNDLVVVGTVFVQKHP